jgi:hypothetical protein
MRGLEIGVFVMTGVMMGMIGADALAAHQLDSSPENRTQKEFNNRDAEVRRQAD